MSITSPRSSSRRGSGDVARFLRLRRFSLTDQNLGSGLTPPGVTFLPALPLERARTNTPVRTPSLLGQVLVMTAVSRTTAVTVQRPLRFEDREDPVAPRRLVAVRGGKGIPDAEHAATDLKDSRGLEVAEGRPPRSRGAYDPSSLSGSTPTTDSRSATRSRAGPGSGIAKLCEDKLQVEISDCPDLLDGRSISVACANLSLSRSTQRCDERWPPVADCNDGLRSSRSQGPLRLRRRSGGDVFRLLFADPSSAKDRRTEEFRLHGY